MSHLPKCVVRKSVTGRFGIVTAEFEMTITLPRSSRKLSLADSADKLNAFKRQNEFLSESGGDFARVRQTLQDVFGPEGGNARNADLKADHTFNKVGATADGWKAILRDTAPLADHFPLPWRSDQPTLLVQVQQQRYVFQTDVM